VAPRASAGGPLAVEALADLPEALSRLARLVLVADHVRPGSVGRLAVDQARTLAIMAGVLERRDRVPGTTAPALFGTAGELRAHANTLLEVRAETRAWRSNGREDPRPRLQMDWIGGFVGHHERRLSRSLTDGDLHVAVATLRPMLLFAPALNHAITRHVHGDEWRAADPASPSAQSRLLATAQAAQDSAVRFARWLPTEPQGQGRRPGRGLRIDSPSWEITR
jgi:hypothetical protein